MEQTSALNARGGLEFADSVSRPAQSGTALGRLALVAGFFLYAALMGAAWWCVLRLAPAEFAVHLHGHTLVLRSLHEKINNAALLFLLLHSALWVECALVGWAGSSARQLLFDRSASIKTDLGCFFLGQGHILDLVGRLMMLGASMISGGWLHDWLQSATGVSIGMGSSPLILQVLVYFYVGSFFDYWTHRVNHARLFWPLHRYHHSATDFAVVTSVRQHPVAFTSILMINVPMAILGARPEVMIYANVLVVTVGFLIHSKIDSDWGWFGRYVIQSPVHHRLHHKLDMTHPTGHFSTAPVWDHLFGTWRGDADQTLPIGVSTPYRHGYFLAHDLVRDYLHFWRGLFGGDYGC